MAAGLLVALPAADVNAAGAGSGNERPQAALVDFADIVARSAPAVVAISVRQIVTPDLPPGVPEYLRERLRQHSGPLRQREANATGSGFFITSDGHIVTNNHVVENARSIEVVLDDGRALPAMIVGRDPLTDIAVLKVEPQDAADEDAAVPVVAAWGDSDALRPGSWTIAVGSPFGLGGTVTVGVLSAAQRDIPTGPYTDFLQTDAAINVGNSGGPLFDARGDVVGVNTAIFSPTGASVGIGFAVPSNVASRVVADLIETGEVRRGYLGANLQDLDGPLARAFGYGERRGALIGQVDEGGPAEAAGLRHGDVIVSIDGRPVETARALSRSIADTEPGAVVAIHYLRAGREEEARVQVVGHEMPEQDALQDAALEMPAADDGPRLGLALRPVPERIREDLGLSEEGVIVQAVRPGGLGASGGLRQGDLILQAGEEPVRRPGDVSSAWEKARQDARPLLLQILRGTDPLYVAIEG